MALSSAFLWRFLDDIWDLLPTEDRELFETYWMGFVRAAGDMQQQIMEANMSLMMANVPVYLTRRWNKYTMDDATCDIFSTSDSIAFSGTDPSTVTYETVFFDTLKVSNATQNIVYTENIQFFDTNPKSLRYGKLVANTISVRIAEQEYTERRDFTVNTISGTIQRTANSRMPTDQLVQISYGHEEYTEDLDYVVDEENKTVARLSGSTIPDGTAVSVYYDYNATTTIPLQGTNGAVLTGLTEFEDTDNNFGGVTAGRTLTILSGPNIGTYTINAVLTSSRLQIGGTFASTQSGDITYTINAFPYAMRVDSAISSIPILQNLIDEPDTRLLEGVDFRVYGGVLASRKAFPLQTLGSEEKRRRTMWAEVTKLNEQTPYRNFGVLIDFFRSNSEAYKLALQGLWYTFWTGSTHGNLITGLHILLGLPYVKNAGTVISVSATQIEIEDPRGQILTYTIPAGLESIVERGDTVDRFDRLTNGVQIIDRINEPGFVADRLGRPGIEKFLTSEASRGPGDTDETKALSLLENHLFLPQILADAITSSINVDEFLTFLNNMRPQWTEFVFSFAAEADESITIEEDEGELDVDPNINLTTTVSSNEFNQIESRGSYLLDGSYGVVLGTGSQATGNFQDLTRDFETAGVGKGGMVRIFEGSFIGLWSVLERISPTLLALDIPDEDLVTETNLEWAAMTVEQTRLNHDSPTIRDPNIILDGANYATPTTLNVKTDAPFSSTELTDDDVKAMLLIDIAITNAEVQGITDADIANGEIQVGTAPSGVPVAQAHEIASVALLREDSGGTATDAVAI